jgi:hypothetical protein
LTSRDRAVPKTEEHERIGRLGLEWEVVRHWTGEDTAAAAKSKPVTAENAELAESDKGKSKP